jgi:hypothetical protein
VHGRLDEAARRYATTARQLGVDADLAAEVVRAHLDDR